MFDSFALMKNRFSCQTLQVFIQFEMNNFLVLVKTVPPLNKGFLHYRHRTVPFVFSYWYFHQLALSLALCVPCR
jgi:hypothetical protein